MTIGNSAFFFVLHLTVAHFRGELQHFGGMGEQKIKCWPVRTCDVSSVRLLDELYADKSFRSSQRKNGVLKISQNFTGKHLCQSPFFNKYAG